MDDDEQVPKRTYYVLGGGLAGMAAAFELTTRFADDIEDGSLRIELIEADSVLGGKARSYVAGPDFAGNYFGRRGLKTDKGYHVFPHWYWDLWALLDEAGFDATDEHKGCRSSTGCKAGKGATFTCPADPASRDYTLIRVMPDKETIKVTDTSFKLSKLGKFLPLLLVMVGLVGASPERLRRRSLQDHLSGRWYAGDSTVERISEIVLKALANPSHDASAFTTANTFRRWLPVYFEANWRACQGPLNDNLIEPFAAVLRERNVVITTERRITHLDFDHTRLAGFGIESSEENRTIDLGRDDRAIIALPHTILAEPDMINWSNGESEEALRPREALHLTNYIESASMASLDLYFAERPTLPAAKAGETDMPLPRAHFSLVESPFATTGFLASDVWDDAATGALPEDANHLLQLVCSDVVTLKTLGPAEATRMVVDDLRKYIPSIKPLAPPEYPPHEPGHGVIVEAVFSMNDGPADRVTRNDAGTWDRRPMASIGLDNAWLAGDYCLCPVDVASMEAAVSTGIAAATALTNNLIAERNQAEAQNEMAEDDEAEGEEFNLPFGGIVPPLKKKLPLGLKSATLAVSAVGLVGAVISFTIGNLVSALLAPNTFARRIALGNLRGSPLKRRNRDLVMMAAGPLSSVLVGIGVVWLWQQAEPGGWQSNPAASGFAYPGAERGTLLALSVAVYLLLLVFAVPTRRFLSRSRGTTTGICATALGYLALPFLSCDAVCALGPTDWSPGDRLPAFVVTGLLSLGLIWSAVAAYRDLEAEEAPLLRVRKLAAGFAVTGLIAAVVAIVGFVIEGGWPSWPATLIVLGIGHSWLLALGIYMPRYLKKAATSLGTSDRSSGNKREALQQAAMAS